MRAPYIFEISEQHKESVKNRDDARQRARARATACQRKTRARCLRHSIRVRARVLITRCRKKRCLRAWRLCALMREAGALRVASAQSAKSDRLPRAVLKFIALRSATRAARYFMHAQQAKPRGAARIARARAIAAPLQRVRTHARACKKNGSRRRKAPD